MAGGIIRRTLLVLSAVFGVGLIMSTIELIGKINRYGNSTRLDESIPALFFLACTAICLGIAGIIQVLERIEKKLDKKDES